MAQVMLKKNFGPQGNARVTLGKNVVRVQFHEGEVYELDLSAWNRDYPAGDYEISLSKGLDKIVSVRPPTGGTHIVKFKQFGNRFNEIPQPKINHGGPRQNKNGGTYIAPPRQTFTAQALVQEGSQYDGLTMIDTMTYGFEPMPGSPDAVISMDSARELEKFDTFMRAQGVNVADLIIPYSPNVLPWLEYYLQENGKPYMVTTNKDGFVESRSNIPAHLMPKEKKSRAKK